MCRRNRRNAPGNGAGFMKKHTFRSASESRKTSSPSGGSARTVTTARTMTKGLGRNGRFSGAAKKIRGMSAVKFREALKVLGIIKANGQLTAKYTLKKK